MGAMTSIVSEVDAEALALIDDAAKASGLSRADFVIDAAVQIARRNADFHAFIQKGVDDVEAGRLLTHEQLVERLRQRRAERRAA